MSAIGWIIGVVTIATSCLLPLAAWMIVSSRAGPEPDTSHLSRDERRGILKRIASSPRLWTITVLALVAATGVTCLAYMNSTQAGVLILPIMCGAPYIGAVFLIMLVFRPARHDIINDELQRLGQLRACPSCGYDITASPAERCPECGGEFLTAQNRR